MKHIKPVTLCIIIAIAAVLTGCSDDKKDSSYWGYFSPGDLRPQGIASEKAYSFTDPNILVSSPTSAPTCGPNIQCMAVYGTWLHGTSYTNSVALSGFVLNDSHLGKTLFTVKIISNAINGWSIYMAIDGVLYTGTAYNADVTITPDYDSSTDTLPACAIPTCATAFTASGVRLQLKRLDFINPVTLTSSDTAIPSITIAAGNYIVAQKYGL